MSEIIDKFSRQDLFELLGEKYAPVKIIAGLQELAKSDPDINQDVEDDAKEFSIDHFLNSKFKILLGIIRIILN
jgi:hypothetical protein